MSENIITGSSTRFTILLKNHSPELAFSAHSVMKQNRYHLSIDLHHSQKDFLRETKRKFCDMFIPFSVTFNAINIVLFSSNCREIEMLPVNQITPLFSEEASLKRFKPWWETVIDWLCCSVIFIAVVTWSIILEGEASGVKCIRKDAQNETFWNSVYAKYCSRRCALELFKGILVYYPYFLSAQGIILIFCQIFWLKIPNVCSKMEAVGIIVKAIEQTNSQEKDKEQKEQKKQEEQEKDRILATLRLGFLLEEGTRSVSYLFLVKSALLCLISSVSFGFIIGLWFNSMELWNNRNVECRLRFVNDVQDRPALSCNIGAGRHTFVILCINLVILALLLVSSIVGALYLFCWKVRGVKEKLSCTPESAESSENEEQQPLLKGTSTGDNDLYFILGLLDSNLHDGGFIIGNIRDLVEELAKKSTQVDPPSTPKPGRSSVESHDTGDQSGHVSSNTDSELIRSNPLSRKGGVQSQLKNSQTNVLSSQTNPQAIQMQVLSHGQSSSQASHLSSRENARLGPSEMQEISLPAVADPDELRSKDKEKWNKNPAESED